MLFQCQWNNTKAYRGSGGRHKCATAKMMPAVSRFLLRALFLPCYESLPSLVEAGPIQKGKCSCEASYNTAESDLYSPKQKAALFLSVFDIAMSTMLLSSPTLLNLFFKSCLDPLVVFFYLFWLV